MKILKNIQSLIIRLIDWLYPFFSSFFKKETFKYAFCGGLNTSLDLLLYFVFYNFILDKNDVHLYFVTISPYIAAFLIVFPITFSSGFLLSKYITFTESPLKGRIQLFRYGVIVSISILLNYIFIKFFVEVCHIYPTPSKMLTTVIVIIFSYIMQRHYTFKTVQVPD